MSFQIFALVRTTLHTKVFFSSDDSLMGDCTKELIMEDENKTVNGGGLENLQLLVFTKINLPFSKSSTKSSSEFD